MKIADKICQVAWVKLYKRKSLLLKATNDTNQKENNSKEILKNKGVIWFVFFARINTDTTRTTAEVQSIIRI